MSTLEVTKEVAQAIINDEIQGIKNDYFRLTCRHKAQKDIGAEEQVLKNIEEQMEKLLQIRASYEEQLEELQ